MEYENSSSDHRPTWNQAPNHTHQLVFHLLPNQYEQDISCPEAVKLDDIDPAAVTSNYEAAKSAFSSAESGSIAAAEAQIDIEVNRAMGAAIGLTLN